MKHLLKRGLSLLMAVVLCVSLLSGLGVTGPAVAVSYVTGDADGFEDVILNWGQRGTTASFLSQNAEAFYSNNGTSYSELSQLSGSADTNAVPSSALYQELAELMTSNHTTITSYGDTRDLYRFTDCQNSNGSSISSFYSGKAIGPKWDSGSTWNREHTWPNSKGLNGSDEDDIMMLRPTASSENSARGNKAYGEGTGFYDPNALSGGTYNLRGDVVRTMLYVYVRWGNTGLWGTDGVIESKDILLKWMEEDPVDTWELGRNDSVESITGTRNVFVDYPELVFVLFGEEIPTDMVTPSGEAFNSGSAYSITAVSNDDAWGTVSVSGKSINAKPADGYKIAGYTVLGGTAQVTRDGDVFTVSASSDCRIRIDFEARVTASVSYSEDATVVSASDVYVDDGIVLPAHTGPVAEGYTFLGWVTSPMNETTAAPGDVYTAGSSYQVSADVTFYALYSRVDSSAVGQSSVYEAYTGKPVEGDYLIVSDGGALKASVSSKNRFDYTAVTITNDDIMDPDADLIWHIVPTSDGYFTIYNESASAYAGGSGTKNQGKLLDSVTDYAKWDISEELIFENLGNRTKGVNYTLRRNATYGFACYAASTGTGMTLYKKAAGTVYYSTATGDACQHIDTTDVQEQLPDCTNGGYTAGVFCNDCQSYISGHEELSALGHSYDTVVTGPTETEQGYTTYTCSVCRDSYVSDYTDALGQLFDVSFLVPSGVTSVANMECGKAGITLPFAGVPAGEYEYSFVGWAAEQIDNSDVKPALYPAGSTFNTEADTVLYAVYSYAPAGSGTGAWELVTDASSLTAGAELVLVSNAKGVVAGSISGKFLTSVSAEFSADLSTITTLPADAVILTLGGAEGAWTLSDAAGQLLGSSAAKNVGWGKGTTTWTITFEEGDAIVQNGTEGNGRFLYNVNSPRFTTYTSNTNTSMLLPQLYKRDGAVGTVYYTTVISGSQTGATISGTVTSGGEDAEVTVQLILDGDVVDSTTVTGNTAAYSISDVVPGAYTLRISKADHVTREYTVRVGDSDVEQDAKICLLGDINGDGKVNLKDWNILYEHVNERSILSGYALLCADVDSDGQVNMKDWNRLYEHINEVDPIW